MGAFEERYIMKKRLLCVLIVLVMVIGILPCPVFASSVKSHTLQASSYGTFTSGADVSEAAISNARALLKMNVSHQKNIQEEKK